jgi:hypothetical protein
MGPKPMRSKISPQSVILFCWLVVAGLLGWTRFYFFCNTAMNQQVFVAYCGRGKGFLSQVNQLISYLIMLQNDEAILFAAQSMLKSETGIATVAGS